MSRETDDHRKCLAQAVAARALLVTGLTLATTAGCATSTANYIGYENYEQLDEAADIVVSAEVLNDRRDLTADPTSPSRIAELRITATSKGSAAVGDEIDLHYDQPTDSDFRLLESETYVIFAAFYADDSEAYAMSDVQGIYGLDGTHIMDYDADQVVLPQEVLADLGK